jgi:hypothetical protein
LSVKRWMKTGVKLDAAVAAAQERFPILLYFPEWDGVPAPYAAMARDLASRGFIVAVVGYESPDCARPDGAVTRRALARWISPPPPPSRGPWRSPIRKSSASPPARQRSSMRWSHSIVTILEADSQGV